MRSWRNNKPGHPSESLAAPFGETSGICPPKGGVSTENTVLSVDRRFLTKIDVDA